MNKWLATYVLKEEHPDKPELLYLKKTLNPNK